MLYKDTIPMLEGHPAISKFHGYDRSWKKLGLFGKLSKEFSMLKKIRKEKYDMVINLTEGDRGALVALVSGAAIRVGVDPEGNGFMGKKKIYTHIVKNCKTPRHTVEKKSRCTPPHRHFSESGRERCLIFDSRGEQKKSR